MYKTVSFNIFEEKLEDIVYRDDSVSQATKQAHGENRQKAGTEKLIRSSTEIIIKPLVDSGTGGERN
jgi:hypothetical protein